METNTAEVAEFENLLRLILSDEPEQVMLALQLRQGVKNERFEKLLSDSIDLCCYSLNVGNFYSESLDFQRLSIGSIKKEFHLIVSKIHLHKLMDLSLVQPRYVIIPRDIGLNCITQLGSFNNQRIEITDNQIHELRTGSIRTDTLILKNCDVRYVSSVCKLRSITLSDCKHLDEDTLSNLSFKTGFSNDTIHLDFSGSNIVTGGGLSDALYNYFTFLDDTSNYMRNQRYRSVVIHLQGTTIAYSRYNLDLFMSRLRDTIDEYLHLGGFASNLQKVVQLRLGSEAVRRNSFAQKLSKEYGIDVNE